MKHAPLGFELRGVVSLNVWVSRPYGQDIATSVCKQQQNFTTTQHCKQRISTVGSKAPPVIKMLPPFFLERFLGPKPKGPRDSSKWPPISQVKRLFGRGEESPTPHFQPRFAKGRFRPHFRRTEKGQGQISAQGILRLRNPDSRAEFWKTNFGRPNFGPEFLGRIF